MACEILSNVVASVTDLQKDPMEVFRSGQGETVAILSEQVPVFYCVSPSMYARLMALVDDAELGRLVDERISDLKHATEVRLDDL